MEHTQYKMIVFDLDGTLLTKDFRLLPCTIKAVNELKLLGLRVSVATGRSYLSAKPFLDSLKIIEPMVFSNGAVFDNPETGFRELLMGIPLEAAIIIILLHQQYHLSLKAHMADGRILKSNDTPWPNEGTHFVAGDITPNLQSKLDEGPIKMVLHGDEKIMIEFVEHAIKILGNRSSVRFFRSHHDYYEISNSQISKGGALLTLVKKLGISPEEVITVGDQENDFEMLRDFGIGIMAGDTSDKLREVAQYQISTPENNGIDELVKIIKRLNAPKPTLPTSN